jgi:hypothetical protein
MFRRDRNKSSLFLFDERRGERAITNCLQLSLWSGLVRGRSGLCNLGWYTQLPNIVLPTLRSKAQSMEKNDFYSIKAF